MRSSAGCLLLVLLALSGCARRLPGPDECRAFALESLGIDSRTPASLLERNPPLAKRAEERTQTCLTKPWDYQLLGCLRQGGSQERCLMGFEQRRALRPANVE